MTTREALEAALVATPDDAAPHAVYADLLIEDGDPRGEFIRFQLAAEDRNQPADKLRELEKAAFEIRQQHEREWLGELWPHLQRPPTAYSVAEPMEPNVSVTWRRGWIDAVRVGQLSDGIVAAIAENPFTQLLGSLAIEQNQHPVEVRDEEDGTTF
ncbi:MAG: TIGR02996 domain-containing protein, partial [Gemmataceae bacterium]